MISMVSGSSEFGSNSPKRCCAAQAHSAQQATISNQEMKIDGRPDNAAAAAQKLLKSGNDTFLA